MTRTRIEDVLMLLNGARGLLAAGIFLAVEIAAMSTGGAAGWAVGIGACVAAVAMVLLTVRRPAG
jgi:hypothetical protein